MAIAVGTRVRIAPEYHPAAKAGFAGKLGVVSSTADGNVRVDLDGGGGVTVGPLDVVPAPDGLCGLPVSGATCVLSAGHGGHTQDGGCSAWPYRSAAPVATPSWWPPAVGAKLRGKGYEGRASDPLLTVVSKFEHEGYAAIVTAERWPEKRRWHFEVIGIAHAEGGLIRPEES